MLGQRSIYRMLIYSEGVFIMEIHSTGSLSRRKFLTTTALAGTALYLGIGPDLGSAAQDPPPETTTLRLRQWAPACWAPIYMAEPLLRDEGFTDIKYVSFPGTELVNTLKREAVDLSASFTPLDMFNAERSNSPLTFLSGLHRGCSTESGGRRSNLAVSVLLELS